MAVTPRPPAAPFGAPDVPNQLRAMANQLVQQATLLQDDARELRKLANQMDGIEDE